MMIKDGEVVDFTKSGVAYTDSRALASEAKVEEAPVQTPLETTVVRASAGASGCYDDPVEAMYTRIKEYGNSPELKELVELAEKEATSDQGFEKLVLDDAALPIQNIMLSPIVEKVEAVQLEREMNARVTQNAKMLEGIFNSAIEGRNKLLAKKVSNRLEMLNEQAEIELTPGLKGQIKALEWVLQEIAK